MRRVILFGAGNALNDTIKYLKSDVKVVCISDNNPKKWGQFIGKYRIVCPDDIRDYNHDMIIISNINYSMQIYKQLRTIGFKNVLPIYNEKLSKEQYFLCKEYLSVTGFLKISFRRKVKEQIFFPSTMGIVINPYYFSRRRILDQIEKYKKYITGYCMDFGCGTMPYSNLFQTKKYIGVEIEGASKREDVIYYDGKRIPFGNEKFDSILCSEVIEHIPNLDEILDELNRVLKKDGYMVLSVPFSYPEHCIPYDFRRISSYGIQQIALEHGFEIIEMSKTGAFIETIAQLRGVYINEIISEKGAFKFIKRLAIGMNNISALIKAKFLPYSDALYLDIVVVLRKTEYKKARD